MIFLGKIILGPPGKNHLQKKPGIARCDYTISYLLKLPDKSTIFIDNLLF